MIDVTRQERARLIKSVAKAVYEYQSYTPHPWSPSPVSFFDILEGTRADVVIACNNVLASRYLEPPLVKQIVTGRDWISIMTLNAHMDWIHAHPFEAHQILNRSRDLSKSIGIERRDNGWHPTLETHMRAETAYHRHSRYKDHEDVSYLDNRDIQLIVEQHADNSDALIQYMDLREWREFDEQNFLESLDQKALKDGWL